jgi:hypothetical protein
MKFFFTLCEKDVDRIIVMCNSLPVAADGDLINEPNKTMTTTEIQIIEAPASLKKFTHASLSDWEANNLAQSIANLTEAGFTVLAANATRSSVPTSYRSAYKMSAPFWIYDGSSIYAVNAKLENRPRGAAIPANFIVAGNVVPAGFRCFARNSDSIVIRSK